MKIDIPDALVEKIVVKELQWAYERTYDMLTDETETPDLDFRESLRDVLAYFMPMHSQNNYFNMIESKYER